MMRQAPTADLSEVLAPETGRGPEPSAATHWAGQRLADVGNEAFQVALARGDIGVAEDLLAVMQRAWDREQAKLGFDRRHADPLLDLARRELQMTKAKRRRC